jgi:hypothetical protein
MESNELVWVCFHDMHSGGGLKEEPYHMIYIQAISEDAAKVIFYNRFGHNPERITCTCCGEDYSISSDPSLEQLTGYHRKCKYDGKAKKYVEEPTRKNAKFQTMEEYLQSDDILVIYTKDVKEEEKYGSVPSEGWVWI